MFAHHFACECMRYVLCLRVVQCAQSCSASLLHAHIRSSDQSVSPTVSVPACVRPRLHSAARPNPTARPSASESDVESLQPHSRPAPAARPAAAHSHRRHRRRWMERPGPNVAKCGVDCGGGEARAGGGPREGGGSMLSPTVHPAARAPPRFRRALVVWELEVAAHDGATH